MDSLAAGMNTPDLQLLRQGDAEAWDAAFKWLWPVAVAVAQGTLQAHLPTDVEDAAIEALEDLVEHVPQVRSVEELKPLTASIAHRRAVSRLREHFAKKRGGGQTESLEANRQEGGNCAWFTPHPGPLPVRGEGEMGSVTEPGIAASPLEALGQLELARLIDELRESLKPEYWSVVSDFFIEGLSYQEIASRRGLAIGSVGVYLKRGLEAIRRTAERQPKLLKELEAFLR